MSGRAAFAELRSDGVRARSGPLSVVHVHDPDGESVRLAFAIGRKVGSAVIRNRVRRRIRHIMCDLTRPDVAGAPTGSYLFIAGQGIAKLTFAELEVAVTEAIQTLAAGDA